MSKKVFKIDKIDKVVEEHKKEELNRKLRQKDYDNIEVKGEALSKQAEQSQRIKELIFTLGLNEVDGNSKNSKKSQQEIINKEIDRYKVDLSIMGDPDVKIKLTKDEKKNLKVSKKYEMNNIKNNISLERHVKKKVNQKKVAKILKKEKDDKKEMKRDSVSWNKVDVSDVFFKTDNPSMDPSVKYRNYLNSKDLKLDEKKNLKSTKHHIVEELDLLETKEWELKNVNIIKDKFIYDDDVDYKAIADKKVVDKLSDMTFEGYGTFYTNELEISKNLKSKKNPNKFKEERMENIKFKISELEELGKIYKNPKNHKVNFDIFENKNLKKKKTKKEIEADKTDNTNKKESKEKPKTKSVKKDNEIKRDKK